MIGTSLRPVAQPAPRTAAIAAGLGAVLTVALVLPVVVPTAEFGPGSVAALLVFAGVGGGFAGRGLTQSWAATPRTTIALLCAWLALSLLLAVAGPYDDTDWLVVVAGVLIGLFGGHPATLAVALVTSFLALWVLVGAAPAFLAAWLVAAAARAVARTRD